MVRALVVGDSALMRRVISGLLGKDQFIQVGGTAENGEEAIENIEA